MSAYRYLFCDLLTDRPITTLELAGVSFERRIVQAGTFQATLPVTNAQTAERVRQVFPPEDQPRSLAGPGRVICHVYRNGDLWGSYVIWQATPAGDSRGKVTLQIQGASLESYLHRREIWDDLAFTGEDQIDIAHALIADMQDEPAGNLGIVPVGAPSGVLRDRQYKASEASTYGDRLAELANLTDGFEYCIRTYLNGEGERVREFVTGQPRLGRPAGDADMVFTRPGNLLSWSYESDATKAATRWRARGDTVNDDLTTDSEPLVGPAVPAQELLDVGWPYVDRTVDYQGARDVATLQGYAEYYAAKRSGAVRIPQITVRLAEDTVVHPNRLGDHARVTIVDDWWPLGADGRPTFAHTWRVVGFQITPPARGAAEQATLILEEAEDGDA
ncbi:hypothetical protein [Actinomadura macrotermitis]|uniref:Minor tail protein n=1 Tax=Actinomadura macrotermitis TaxID=2585200 RepID=A0A7K0C2V5_9ACTN|nr:hypothetical protein [Actinomadura macrotermitis]MQY07748.1 hypothetical protein [Actinomadura macrotermitis]